MTACMMLSEGVYDLVFAIMAYGASGRASTVATTYGIGYGAEILVTIAGAGFLDWVDRRRAFIATQLVSIALFVVALTVARLTSMTERTIWLFAFLADLVHHYARLALFTLLPSLFPREELGRIAGTRAIIVGISR